MKKRSRQRFSRRFNFALPSEMHGEMLEVATAANEDIAEVLRLMIRRELPFFMRYVSQYRKLPPGEMRRAKEPQS